jgi:hypothetical protein
VYPRDLSEIKRTWRIIKEQAFVLILLYPYATRDKSSGHIERLRSRYKEEFDQVSVLRIGDPSIVWVWF